MTLVNTDYISRRELQTLGLVKGSTIRAKHLGNDIMAALKMIVGGELTGYGDMINEARAVATKRMVEEATEIGADAVINVRYATSSVARSAAEVLVYGTAVKYSPE